MLGVATSGSTLFRSIGGSLGTAILGAIFTARLTSELPAAPSVAASTRRRSTACPRAAHDAYISAFTDALQAVFTVATIVVLVAFALYVAVEELRIAGLLDGERPTAAGVVMRERLVVARTAGLRALVDDWEPDRNPELDPLLRRLAHELAAPA